MFNKKSYPKEIEIKNRHFLEIYDKEYVLDIILPIGLLCNRKFNELQ